MRDNTSTDDTERVEIEVSSESVALEIGYGIMGRAQDIHDNPDDESEYIAEELKDVALEIIERYEGANADE